MSSKTLDFVTLVEKNPLTCLPEHKNYGPLVDKIKKNCSIDEQHFFVANLFCYLNYDIHKDFIIDIENIWKWVGFGRRGDCRNILINNFTENIDYKIITDDSILMTFYCFKLLCMTAKTKKQKK
jgi:hypothetical protein